MRPFFWLASYPKSGSTWFRMLLAHVRATAPLDINMMRGRGGIASARARFDETLLIPSGLLTHDECDRLRPLVYQAMVEDMADHREDAADDDGIGSLGVRVVKTHDAWTSTSSGEPLMGGVQAARGVILLVRDPRDVAPSLASHNGQSIDDAIAFMAGPDTSFCGRIDRQHNQLRQQLCGWSGYCRSWLDQTDLPVHLVRYEDLHADTAGLLGQALSFVGVDEARDPIDRAVAFSSFASLSRQEEERGFREAPTQRHGPFFRRGVAGGWHDELTEDQASRIVADHHVMMERLGYVCSSGPTS